MTVQMNIDLTKFKNKVSNLLSVETQLVDQIYRHFHDITPYKTGNARAHTILVKNRIVAGYPYAEKLDQGYSKQAPKGMTGPTEEFAKKIITQAIQKIGKK